MRKKLLHGTPHRGEDEEGKLSKSVTIHYYDKEKKAIER